MYNWKSFSVEKLLDTPGNKLHSSEFISIIDE